MPDYTKSRLWKSALEARKNDDDSEKREELSAAFKQMRKRAADIAAGIRLDLPGFTVHDVNHMDALWERAEVIAGPQVSLTPIETFVLGGAFLAHDLGMAMAAYPEGLEALKKNTDLWNDAIGQALKTQFGHTPSLAQIEKPDEKSQELAKRELLRELHAKKAEELPRQYWQSRKSGDRIYLIDTPELRKAFGATIGEVAASHHWSIKEVRKRFEARRSVGPPDGFPNWRLDLIKLACLMRAADAADVDAGRAPLFLSVLLQPTGVAADHWTFQGKLNQPTVVDDRLVYASNDGFPQEDAQAWWLCLDTLRMVDGELRDIDELLVTLGAGYQFEAKGVKSVGNLEDFSKLIRPIDWEPIDTRIHVTDVASLVQSLGGKSLYGDDVFVPLRELIQNGCDAVRARRLLLEGEDEPEKWGRVTLRIGIDPPAEPGGAEVPWIEVEDNGVGMSPNVLKGALLDFGRSFWGTREMRDEFPGLLGKAFESVGKYGIGFYSVFMLGERVRVTTRRYEKGVDDTFILTFDAGLRSRPVLRRAQKHEQLSVGGTRVRVYRPRNKPDTYPRVEYDNYDLNGWIKRLGWLCPTLDVQLRLAFKEEKIQTVSDAFDWVTMDGMALLRRLYYLGAPESLPIPNPGDQLAVLKDQARPIGRALIIPSTTTRGVDESGCVTVGGMRTTIFNGKLAGVLLGISTTASRQQALPLVAADELARWAGEQGAALTKLVEDQRLEVEDIAATAAAMGGDIQGLKLLRLGASERQVASIQDACTALQATTRILVIDSSVTWTPIPPPTIRCVLIKTQPNDIFKGKVDEELWPPYPKGQPQGFARLARSPAGIFVRALANAWAVDVQDVLKEAGFNFVSGRFEGPVQEEAKTLVDHVHRGHVGERIFLIKKPGA